MKTINRDQLRALLTSAHPIPITLEETQKLYQFFFSQSPYSSVISGRPALVINNNNLGSYDYRNNVIYINLTHPKLQEIPALLALAVFHELRHWWQYNQKWIGASWRDINGDNKELFRGVETYDSRYYDVRSVCPSDHNKYKEALTEIDANWAAIKMVVKYNKTIPPTK